MNSPKNHYSSFRPLPLTESWIGLSALIASGLVLFVITMIVFMMRTARHLKGQIEHKVDALARGSSALGLFLFVFLMVLREGVETVLILSAVELNSTELMSLLGTLLGVAALFHPDILVEIEATAVA